VCRSKTVLYEKSFQILVKTIRPWVGAQECRLPTSNTRYSTRTPTLSSENSWRILIMSVRVSLQTYFLSSLFYFLDFPYNIHSHCGVLFFRDPRSRYIGLFNGVSAITSEPRKIRQQVKLGKKSFSEMIQMSLTKWYVFNWNIWKNCVASVACELSQNSCRHANIYRLLRSLNSFEQIIWRTIKLSLHGILFFTHFGQILVIFKKNSHADVSALLSVFWVWWLARTINKHCYQKYCSKLNWGKIQGENTQFSKIWKKRFFEFYAKTTCISGFESAPLEKMRKIPWK